jgi:hypothetical protein
MLMVGDIHQLSSEKGHMATNRERTQGKAKTHISREDRKAHKNAKEQSLATYDDEPKDEETP